VSGPVEYQVYYTYAKLVEVLPLTFTQVALQHPNLESQYNSADDPFAYVWGIDPTPIAD
jgi:hypothetical protein